MRRAIGPAVVLALAVVMAPVWLPALAILILVVIGGRFIKVAALYVVVWCFWLGSSPRRVLFVYSDSPHWKAHIESRILPRLPANTVILNWSRRKQWSGLSLPVVLFRCFAGERDFNPIGLVFERWRTVEDYRFWQPFRDARHGHTGSLEFVEAQFLRHAAG